MKRVLFFIVVLATALGCRKLTESNRSSGLLGSWEVRGEYGGIAGISKTYPAGNGHIIQFNADSTFKMYQQSSIVNQGTFSIIKNGITSGQAKLDAISFNHNPADQFVQLNADTLTIGMDFPDGMTSVYVRK